MRRTGLLGEEKVVTLLQGDTVTVEEVSFQCFHCALRRRILLLTESTCHRERSERGGQTW